MAARGIVWTHEETVDLISLLGNENVQVQLEGARHNHKVYARLAESLAELGYELRNHKQCQDKVKKLKVKYREVLDHNNRSGKRRKTWEHFDRLDRILGSRPTSRPEVLLQSIDDDSEKEESDAYTIDEEEVDIDGTSATSLVELEDQRSYGGDKSDDLLDVDESDVDGDSSKDLAPKGASTRISFRSGKHCRSKDEVDTQRVKKQKKRKIEKAVDTAIDKFAAVLKEVHSNFLEIEKERQIKEDANKKKSI